MSSFLVKSTLFVAISEIIYNVSGFVIHAVVGRILGPADYGRYGLVVTLTTMVIILIGNGIPTAMSKYISEIFDRDKPMVKTIKRQTIVLQTILIAGITLIFFMLAPVISRILGDPSLTRLFRISTLIIPMFAAASFYFSYYTGLHRFNIQSFLKIMRSIFRVVFIIGLAYYFHLEGSILGYVAAPAAVFLFAYAIDKFKVSKEQAPETDTKPFFDWHKLINYAWQIVVFFLAYELLISIDLYLVQGILKNDYLTGIYNASLTVGRIPYYIFYALTVILLPVISKTTSQNNQAETARIISQTLRVMLILLIPSIVCMSVFSKSIIQLFYGNRYLDAAYPMAILVWGVGFLTIYYVFCFIMSGANKVAKPMIISVIGLVINSGLNYAFIRAYGISGSAIATSITSALITFIMLYYVWKDFGVKVKTRDFMRMVLAGEVIYLIAIFLSQGRIMFIVWSLLLFAIYFVLLYILGEIKKEDVLFLKKSFAKSN